MKNEKIVDLAIDCLAVLCAILGIAMFSGATNLVTTILSVLSSGIFILTSISLFMLQEKRFKIRKRKHLALAKKAHYAHTANTASVKIRVA